jgi:ribonuclease BN (tRNA processing enzyme)
MSDVIVRFLGSGDAFGTDGRFQTCILIRTERNHLLMDCGTSSLIAMKRFGVDPGALDAVLVSHLHGDHFGGIPFLLLDQQFSRRDRPLVLAGPAGLKERVCQALEVLFPGSSAIEWRYRVEFVVLAEQLVTTVADIEIKAYPVIHSSGAPAFGLRVTCAERVVSYSGDTEWVPALVDLAQGADLFICEAYTYEKRLRYHLAYADVRVHRGELKAARVVLTHPGPDLIAHSALVADEIAEDGLEFRL